jgi:predicted DNA-binding transcriptional regulator AlpA
MRQNSTTKLRPQTARLTCRLLAPLLDSGLVSSDEYAIIKRNLDALAKTGELAPAIPHKLITSQEVAEMLCISCSQFRQLEKDGIFEPYFKRRMIGNKTVRYYLPDIIKYMANAEAEAE